MKTLGYEKMRKNEGFSLFQTGDFSLSGKGLRGFFLIECEMRARRGVILYQQNLLIASLYHSFNKLLILVKKHRVRRRDNPSLFQTGVCASGYFLPVISNFFAYIRLISHNDASYCLGGRHG